MEESEQEDEKMGVQIYPSKIRVEPNDKVTKVIFSLTEELNEHLLRGGIINIIETKKVRGVGEIMSPVQLENEEESQDSNPLNIYDRAVHAVCVSEWLAGNRYTTAAVIYRGLTGKVKRGSNAQPHPGQREKILRSVSKLMSKRFTYDGTEVCERLKYNDGHPLRIRAALLPARYVQAHVGGQDITAIKFEEESPLYKIANIKNQILRYDVSLLDVPGQQNSEMNIMLKNYVMSRVQEIKAHREMLPTMTFEDIFKKCRLENVGERRKQEARKTVKEFLEHLKGKKLIKEFELKKIRRRVQAVSFK